MGKQGLVSGNLLNHQVLQAAGLGQSSFPALFVYWQKHFNFKRTEAMGHLSRQRFI